MAGLDSARSQLAAGLIEDRLEQFPKNPEFWSQVKDLPSALRINGLLAVTLEREKMKDLLEPWLTSTDAPVAWEKASGDLNARLRTASRSVYRQASAEALQFAIWLKRWEAALHV